ncbi:MAG: RsbRD N-terminal domain-containing protein [bacterium]
MTLNSLLTQSKAAVLQRWRDLIVQTYPDEVSRFLQRETDRFANPVGDTIFRGTESIFDLLLNAQATPEDMTEAVDGIVRIRSVQEFNASQAVVFVFLLKKAIREQLGEKVQGNGVTDELLDLESRIDQIALAAFDCWAGCREQINDIRVNEIRNGVFKLRERINLPRDHPPNCGECSSTADTDGPGGNMKEGRSGR